MTTILQTSHSTAETVQLGKRLGYLLQAGQIICLAGTLGAGKTHLTRGIALGWGTTDHPTSPTFSLVNQYQRLSDSQRFYHLDCYRLNTPAEVWGIGFEDILNDDNAIVVIEWPERIEPTLPQEKLWVTISQPAQDTRTFALTATGQQSKMLLQSLQQIS